MRRILTLVFISFLFLSCKSDKQNEELKESEKVKVVLIENILDKDYLSEFEFRKDTFYKSGNESELKTTYSHESEVWKKNQKIGTFYCVTHEYNVNDVSRMQDYFTGIILGLKANDAVSSNVNYFENNDFILPFERYQTFKLLNSDELNLGYLFNILKGKKIISILVNINDEFKIDTDELVKRINKM